MDSSKTTVENEDVNHCQHESDSETDSEIEIPRTGKKRKANLGGSEASSHIPVKKERSYLWKHFSRTEANVNKCKCH